MRLMLRGCAVSIAISLVATAALAQDVVWQPPEPSVKSKDWRRLTSGEWLRGEAWNE
jgi:hypothetical protein